MARCDVSPAPCWGGGMVNPLSGTWGHQQGPPHGSPQTWRPWRPCSRGLDEREAGGHEELAGCGGSSRAYKNPGG